MDLEIIIFSEISQTEEDKYHMRLLICGILKKINPSELIYKTNSQTWKTNFSYQRGILGRERKEFVTSIYTLLYTKCLNSKDLLCSTARSTQYSVIIYMRKECGQEWLYV